MKGFGKALIVAGSLSVGGILIGCIGSAIILKGGETRTSKPAYEEKYYSVEVSEIDAIEMDLSSDDVQIEVGTGDEIEITYWDEIDDPKYQIRESNGTLLINRKASVQIVFIPTFEDLWNETEVREMTIRVPREYAGSYDLDFTSGSLSVSDLTIEEEFVVGATSGDIQLNNLQMNSDATVDLSSGSVSVNAVAVEGDLTTLLTSGNVEMEHIAVGGDMHIDMTSGDISMENVDVKGTCRVEGSSGSLDCDILAAKDVLVYATSGNYDLMEVTVEQEIYVDATSGDITVSLTDEMENYSIVADTTSGYCNLPVLTNGGDKKISVYLTSGDADFSFKEADDE